MEAAAAAVLPALVPSQSAVGASSLISRVVVLLAYLGYLAVAGAILPGKLVAGAVLPDSSRLHYRCNGTPAAAAIARTMLPPGPIPEFPGQTAALLRVIFLHHFDVRFPQVCSRSCCFWGSLRWVPTWVGCLQRNVPNDKVSFALYFAGLQSRHKSSSLKPHVSGNFLQDWWLGVQLNPHFMGVDLKFFFVRAGMMAWLFINLSLFAKSYLAGSVNLSVILYQFFCGWYIIDYFVHEEFMTSTWDIIAERLGFMLVFGDLVFIPFTFTIQGWWLLRNKVELPLLAAVANCCIFVIGYLVFRGANKQKHVFKKDPKALIWGKPPKVVGGKLLASGYWGIARHCNYLGDLLLALSFSLPCGASSVIPYFYPTYLLILLIWRERRDEARCSQKYKEIWVEYCKLVPWRILPYVY
ncbi:hypothetical protein EJB05_44130, partial [Eragrostis curvula]